MQEQRVVLHYIYMNEPHIICKPTADTFVRFGIVIAAVFGFALYFFYDGHTGYRQKNEVLFSYKTFAELGQKSLEYTPEQWQELMQNRPLLQAENVGGDLCLKDGENTYPLPRDCEAVRSCPPEVLDHAALSRSWNESWTNYTRRMHFPIKPAEHPYDIGAIREQWIAGGLFIALGSLLLFLALRTRGRVMALEGDQVTVAGQVFRVADIELIDLRQWGVGFKGCAYLTVKGRKVKADGMTYGGFSRAKGEPAEVFMKALLSRYSGDIIEYEEVKPQNTDG